VNFGFHGTQRTESRRGLHTREVGHLRLVEPFSDDSGLEQVLAKAGVLDPRAIEPEISVSERY
jgi:hypothetical protein